MGDKTFDFKLKSERKLVLKASDEAVEKGLAAIGMTMVRYTHRPKEQGGTPVKEGNLRDSIAWATEHQSGGGDDKNPEDRGGKDAPEGGGAKKGTVLIGSNVEYAKPVEEGTSRRKAAHMLRNAVVDSRVENEAIMRAALDSD